MLAVNSKAGDRDLPRELGGTVVRRGQPSWSTNAASLYSTLSAIGFATMPPGAIVFEHACALGCEGIVSKRLGSPYRAGRSAHWLKVKNPAAQAVKREAEEEWQ